MKLIDADALLDDWMERYCKPCDRRRGIKNGKWRVIYEIGEAPCRACAVGDMMDELEETPSAERTGHWIPKNYVEYFSGDCASSFARAYTFECSECGAKYIGNYDAYDEPSDFNYCPNCGARMVSEDDT